MIADPFGTLRAALWIGGAQWAGKSTVARLLAFRHSLTVYHYDHQDARGHDDRRVAQRVRRGEPPNGPDPDDVWVHTTPERMAATTLAGFPARYEWALDDLRALWSPRPIIAEGWVLRPELVAPLLASPNQMVVMVPTADFRAHQVRHLPRAAAIGNRVSDPEQGQRNRLARDALVAADAVRSARGLGIPVIEVDGTLDAEGVADLVAGLFGAHLPA